ncbi:hypothetical protein RUM44_003752 [Polyplax serrata]|uniref:Uncharacterized protein n=1 Tax=Polyplax serrata TaxID=468196 RepID=A0ABR1AHC9_POLSC
MRTATTTATKSIWTDLGVINSRQSQKKRGIEMNTPDRRERQGLHLVVEHVLSTVSAQLSTNPKLLLDELPYSIREPYSTDKPFKVRESTSYCPEGMKRAATGNDIPLR